MHTFATCQANCVRGSPQSGPHQTQDEGVKDPDEDIVTS